jgi:hypothetical protein
MVLKQHHMWKTSPRVGKTPDNYILSGFIIHVYISITSVCSMWGRVLHPQRYHLLSLPSSQLSCSQVKRRHWLFVAAISFLLQRSIKSLFSAVGFHQLSCSQANRRHLLLADVFFSTRTGSKKFDRLLLGYGSADSIGQPTHR